MYWSKIVEELKKEETVCIPYEANITGQIIGFHGNEPIYNYHVQYFTQEGFKEEDFVTLEEVYNCAMTNLSFRKCRVCGNIITEDFYVCKEDEMNEPNITKDGRVIDSNEYCCITCLLHDLNKVYGGDGYDFDPLHLNQPQEEDTEYFFRKKIGKSEKGHDIAYCASRSLLYSPH